jgi:hypothetical protein
LQRLTSRNEISYRRVKTPREGAVVFDREILDRYLSERARAILSPAVSTLAPEPATAATALSPSDLVEIIAARGGRECGYSGKSLEGRARRLSPRTFPPHKDGPHRLDEALAVCGAYARARKAFTEAEFKTWLASRVPPVQAAESRRALDHINEFARQGRVADLGDKLALTPGEVVDFSGLGRSVIEAAISQGKLKASKAGQRGGRGPLSVRTSSSGFGASEEGK